MHLFDKILSDDCTVYQFSKTLEFCNALCHVPDHNAESSVLQVCVYSSFPYLQRVGVGVVIDSKCNETLM